MRILIKVVAHSKKPGVYEMEDGLLKVAVNASPERGKANREVIERIADHFSVSKSHVRIVVGEKTDRKILEVTQ